MERLTKKMENGNGYLPATEAKTTGEFTMRYAKELQRLGELEEKIENGELVEVVRCKDCNNMDGIGCPFFDGINKTDNDFCNYGKRRIKK